MTTSSLPAANTASAAPEPANDVCPPPYRRLRVYAFDPSLDTQMETAVINRVTLKVPWGKELTPGPVDDYLEVIDFDPASRCFYAPVDLNDRFLLAEDGLEPSEGSPPFHQQMVYAVARITIDNFEKALGRKALWSPRIVQDADRVQREEFIRRLRIYPHALRKANAYYSPAKKALLFGYFPATATRPDKHLPSGIVFTCLSHDVIAHETTHALLDGMHDRFLEPSNRDLLAFHEAFADIVALFQHFSLPEVLRHQLTKTRGDLASQSLLGQLAQQFGETTGHYGALRDALGKPDPDTKEWKPLRPDPSALERVSEPHARGALLVAAVFDAFLSIYRSRIADLLRIATSGTGVLPAGALHPDLVNRLAREAAKSAQHVLNMCIRALDYCPPVDLNFGDYLRALITADYDLVRDDDLGYRIAFIEAFRRRGIYPRDVRTLSVESLRWQPPAVQFRDVSVPFGPDLVSLAGDWDLSSDREEIFQAIATRRDMVREWVAENIQPEASRLIGLDLSDTRANPYNPDDKENARPAFDVTALRPARRIGPDGQHLVDLIVEITQKRWEPLLDPPPAPPVAGGRDGFWFRGGCTLVVDLRTGGIRYCILKNMRRPDGTPSDRLRRQREFLTGGAVPSLQATYFGNLEQDGEPFAFLHGATGDEEVSP